MTAFQFLLILGVLAIAILALRLFKGDRSTAIKRVLAIIAAIAAIIAILFPALLTAVANFFGIGRGADLLLYISIIGGLLLAVALIRSKARSDARVTQLARAVALMEAHLLEQQQEQPADTSDKSGESA